MRKGSELFGRVISIFELQLGDVEFSLKTIMRAPPAPTLQNVLVSHPVAASKGTVAKPDDLLAAAVLAADDSHDIARPRGVLARVTRKWHALWHRRHARRRDNAIQAPGHGRSHSNATAAIANADASSWLLRSSRSTGRPKHAIAAPLSPSTQVPSSSTASAYAAPIIDSRDLDNNCVHVDGTSSVSYPQNCTNQACVSTGPPMSPTRPLPNQYSQHAPAVATAFSSTSSPHHSGDGYHPAAALQHYQSNTVSVDRTSLHSEQSESLTNSRMPSDLKSSPFSLPPIASQVILSRESALRAQRLEEHQLALERLEQDDQNDIADERCVSSLRENWSTRRVRQVGARDDDDTVLQLPRVASVSFTTPGGDGRLKSSKSVDTSLAPRHHHHNHHHHQKVVQLPRVSALMPTRAVRKPTHVQQNDLFSPVSSAGQQSRTGSDSGASDALSVNARRRKLRKARVTAIPYSNDDDEFNLDHQSAVDDDDAEDDDIVVEPGNNDVDSNDMESRSESEDSSTEDEEGEVNTEDDDSGDMPREFERRQRLTRLPTGMSKRDVEREMELAVVEIASDGGESDVDVDSVSMDAAEPVSGSPPSSASAIGVSPVSNECCDDDPLIVRVRSRSDLQDRRVCSEVCEEPFVRRVSSTLQANSGVVEGIAPVIPRRFSISASDGAAAVAARSSQLSIRVAHCSKGCSSTSDGSQRDRDLVGKERAEDKVEVEVDYKNIKRRTSESHEVAMFEDDYLSFQGFNQSKTGESMTTSRSHYSGMTALLRSKRISSVTDSHSDESEDGPSGSRSRGSAGAVPSFSKVKGGIGGGGGRAGRLPQLLRKWSALEENQKDFGG